MRYVLAIMFFAFLLDASAQNNIGIGTTTPNSSALLDVSSTNKGLLIPRMTAVQRLSINPATNAKALMVFDTDSSAFFFWTGTVWSKLGASGGNSSQWVNNGNNIYNNNSGNVGIGNVTPGYPLSFPNQAGDKISLFPEVNGNHYGMGIGNSTMQLITPNSNADVVFGFGHSASFTENMRVKGNGNVGIGETNPLLGGLVVNKKMGATNAVFGSNSAGVAIESTIPGIGFNTYDDDFSRKTIASGFGGYMGVNPSTGEMVFSTTNASFPAGSSVSSNLGLSINSNGNTGVGVTADPNYKMDVGGRMRIRSTPGLSAGHWLNNNTNSTTPAFVGMQTDTKVGFYGTGIGWGFTMNTQNGSLSLNGNAGIYGQVAASKGDNQATSWTKLGNLLQTYYRYQPYAASVPTGDPLIKEFEGGSMAITTPGKSRLIISAMFTAYADCGVCYLFRDGFIRLNINGNSDRVIRIIVQPNSTQIVTLSNYFYDVPGGNHTLKWELDQNTFDPISSAYISNVTVMALPID